MLLQMHKSEPEEKGKTDYDIFNSIYYYIIIIIKNYFLKNYLYSFE
jgi:hypothetical protein